MRTDAARSIGPRRSLGLSVRRRIEALDPDTDAEEMARLTFEVLHGDPPAVHAGYLLGFCRQMAVPHIAEVVYQGGGGKNLRDVGRRTEDTLALFGAFLHHGHSSPEGRAAIARMERVHARFAITEEQKLYTLATLVFEAERIGRHLGVEVLSPAQREASWRFWRGVAAQMPLAGLPASGEELLGWMVDYERREWRHSEAGRAVVECFFKDWSERWFPGATRRLSRRILLALMEPGLRAALRLPEPGVWVERAVRAGMRLYVPLALLRPLRTDRSWSDHFGSAGRRRG